MLIRNFWDSQKTIKLANYQKICNKILENANKISEIECLNLAQTFSLFGFFENPEIFKNVLVSFSQNCHHFSISYFARIFYIFVQFNADINELLPLLNIFQDKIQNSLLKDPSCDKITLIAAVDFYLVLLKLSAQQNLDFKWKNLFAKKVFKNFDKLSKFIQIIIGWHVAFFEPSSFPEFELTFQKLLSQQNSNFSFFESYLLNEIRFFIKPASDTSFNHNYFQDKLKKYEIQQICDRKINPENFESILHKYAQIVQQKFPDEKVQESKCFITKQGCVLYLPIFLPTSKIGIEFLNDQQNNFQEKSAFLASKQFILQENQIEIKNVTMSTLLGFQIIEGVDNFDEFEDYRREVIDELFRNPSEN